MIRPSVLIHVQHLLGIGHFVRACHVAKGLADAGFDVHLVSGGMPVEGRAPRSVRLVQLPPIRVADASFAPLRDAAMVPIDEAFREGRRDLLLAAYEEAQPSVVLIETFPFGRRALRFELVPLLERIEKARPRPLVLTSVRDILQRQSKPEREREMLESARRWFDGVLVHGDRRFARFEESFVLPGALEHAPPVHYTGFVVAEGAAPASAVERREVVVSAGGGAVGVDLLATALAAQAQSRFGHLTWRVLAGPNVPEVGLQRLLRAAGPRAIVERSRVDLAAALRHAFVSISQAGYNTVLDVAASGARAVFVPFASDGQTEQAARAARLAAFDLGVIADEHNLSASSLANAVDEAGSREHWGRWDFDCGGAARTAKIVAGMIELDDPREARAPA